jgi:hypothetical protein
MQALRESLEALRSELLGKPDGLGNFSELPNPYEVTDSELQIELGNLKTELSNLATENEKIRADYAALLESSTVVTKKLGQEVQELRSQLQAEKIRYKELEEEHEDVEKWWRESKAKVTALETENSDLKQKLAAAPTENLEPEQKSASGVEFPEAAKIYNQFKAQNPKTKTTYKEVVAILARVQAMIEES